MNTTTRGVMLLSAMLLAGCASQPTASQAPISPTCTVADCEVKWAAARTFVINHAGMKLQTYSADYMQTYSPVGGSTALGAEVNKQPIPGGYAIVAKFWCDNPFGCFPKADETLREFTAAVNAAAP